MMAQHVALPAVLVLMLSHGASGLDIIGYYGNSGNAVSSIPTIGGIHSAYNVVILTFGTVDGAGNFSLDIQGPYKKNQEKLAADIKAWKGVPDQWGRTKYALLSIGGQNGHWPAIGSSAAIETGLMSFMDSLYLDGLDIDLESGLSKTTLANMAPLIKSLRHAGKVVTAAPEAAQTSLDLYKSTMSLLTWVQPQFYDNGPNAITVPYVPDAKLWPAPWSVKDWQAESGGESFWAGSLDAIGKAAGLSQSQKGMLMPMCADALGAHWSIPKFVKQVKASGVSHVGNWAIAYDKQKGWPFAMGLAALLGDPQSVLV